MKNLIIGISGIRGIYGQHLTEKHALDFGRAFGLWMREERVIVGRDTRKSGESLKEYFVRGLVETGKNVYDAGIVPTPALTWFAEKHAGFCAAVITASHNPAQYNGIKLISPSGTFLNLREFASFFKVYKSLNKNRSIKTGKYYKYDTLMESFFGSLINCVDHKLIKEKNFKVIVDPVQGAGALCSRKFLEMLGCRVIMINEDPAGEFSHNPEPMPCNLTLLSKEVEHRSASVGFAQDPDCDRLALIAEDGSFISEENGLALLIRWMLQKKKGSVVVNVATTKIIDDLCDQFNVKLFRTKVGEVHVVETMKKTGAVAGGEGNGGIVMPAFHYGRDSFAGMALTLEMMAKTNLKLTEAVSSLPVYFFIKKKMDFPVSRIRMLYRRLEKEFSSGKISYPDGLRIDFEDGWIGVRPSGTEPIIRIFVEGKEKGKVFAALKLIEDRIISCR
ncbi:MAG: phosphoglucosamine mutase, partial [Candidatus Omnitrophica bacterium]|nr:phosphoglucosamine mutase [Candidatus Omnitrophota bacterium]